MSIDDERSLGAAPTLVVGLDLRVVAADDGYRLLTGATRVEIAGDLRASLERALASGKPDEMPLQRFGRPGSPAFETGEWLPVTTPLFDSDGELVVLLHRLQQPVTADRWSGRGDRVDVGPALRAEVDAGRQQRTDRRVDTGSSQQRASQQRQVRDELERVATQQAMVAALGHDALGGVEAPDLMARVAAAIIDVYAIEYCEVLELPAGGGPLAVRVGAGWADLPTGVARASGMSLATLTLSFSEPVTVTDVGAETRFTVPAELVAHGVGSAMATIIGDVDRPLGLVAAYSTRPAMFPPDDHAFLGAVANILGNAIQRGRREAEMRRQALHDDLTGLPNRKLLLDRLSQGLAASRRHAAPGTLMLCDLDHFKDINDTLGHQAGDAALRQVGARLLAALRDSDTVARLGGDEFALLLPDVGTFEEAATVAGKVLATIREPLDVGGRQLRVDASLGMVVYPLQGDDTAVLLQRADIAMYAAKRSGSGHGFYAPEQDRHAGQRLGIVGDLRGAIQDGRLRLEYQPILTLADGTLSALEALVRWDHPRRGAVPPDEFVPIAEEAGLIDDLTAWVLHEALEQARRWRDDRLPAVVAVNISAACMHDPGVVELILTALADAGVPASGLELELTETAVMRSPGAALEIMRRLAEAGVRLSIDDFGTGYSSLDYLQRLPVSELKIDRTIVSDLITSARGGSIVNSVIDMAHSLDLTVVAEGIESQQVLETLRDGSCDRGQGFYLHRPVPAADMTAWLCRHRAELFPPT